MAKSNLLRPLNTGSTNPSNNFYTFSQWAEDLTLQNALGDAYRIVPSRFACFNVDNTAGMVVKLQNSFEHRCAAFRYFLDNDTDTTERFTPRHASILFWDTIRSYVGGNTASNMVYVGEMDIQGTNYIDGVTYSEMYCIIPIGAKKMVDWVQASDPGSGSDIEYTNPCLDSGYPFRWTHSSYPQTGAIQTHNADAPAVLPNCFDGPAILTCEDNQTRYSSLNTLDSLHKIYMQDILYSQNYFDLSTDAQFSFNVIALYYDIVAKDEHNDYKYLYTAVPMGIYFAHDPIVKYVTNDDIYGQGTSYGLRVTTKFCANSIVPQGGANVDGSNNIEVTASTGEIYPEVSAVMDRFNAAAIALDDYTEKIQTSIGTLNNHLSNFKDNKVNVPYIREIKGAGDTKPEKYWFVNGRSTGVKVEGQITEVIHYDPNDPDNPSDITEVIQEMINNSVTNIIDSSFTQYIDDSITNQIQNINPGNVLEDGTWIKYIEPNKYHNSNGSNGVVHIPQTEDFQDIRGTDSVEMFWNDNMLEEVPRLELQNAECLNGTFEGCRLLKVLYLPDTIGVGSFRLAVKNCENLKTLVFDATSADDSYVGSFGNCFYETFSGCSNLENLRISNINPTKVNELDLRPCTSLSFASLEYIVMNMQTQEWQTGFDTNGPAASITIKLPPQFSTSSRSVMDLIYNVLVNKNIELIFN